MMFSVTNVFKRENEVADLAIKLGEAVTRCVSAGETGVLAYMKGELPHAALAQEKAKEFRSAAITSRRSIRDHLFSGAYLPLTRGDIFTAVESLSKVPDAAVSCCCFFLSEKPSVPDQLRERFSAVVVEAFGMTSFLRGAVDRLFSAGRRAGGSHVFAHDVGIRESRIDDMKWSLTEAIFQTETLDRNRKHDLKVALEHIVRLSDVVESATNHLELAVVKTFQ